MWMVIWLVNIKVSGILVACGCISVHIPQCVVPTTPYLGIVKFHVCIEKEMSGLQ